MNKYKRIMRTAAGGLLIAFSLSMSRAQEHNPASDTAPEAELRKADLESFDQQRAARQTEIDHELAEWNAAMATDDDDEAAAAKRRIAKKAAGEKRLKTMRTLSKSRKDAEQSQRLWIK